MRRTLQLARTICQRAKEHSDVSMHRGIGVFMRFVRFAHIYLRIHLHWCEKALFFATIHNVLFLFQFFFLFLTSLVSWYRYEILLTSSMNYQRDNIGIAFYKVITHLPMGTHSCLLMLFVVFFFLCHPFASHILRLNHLWIEFLIVSRHFHLILISFVAFFPLFRWVCKFPWNLSRVVWRRQCLIDRKHKKSWIQPFRTIDGIKVNIKMALSFR